MAISLLLLESDESARMAFAGALREAGWSVSIAPDTTAAYAAATTNVPDVIVIGFDEAIRADRFGLCKRLGADPRTRHVPILVTSAAWLSTTWSSPRPRVCSSSSSSLVTPPSW